MGRPWDTALAAFLFIHEIHARPREAARKFTLTMKAPILTKGQAHLSTASSRDNPGDRENDEEEEC